MVMVVMGVVGSEAADVKRLAVEELSKSGGRGSGVPDVGSQHEIL